MGDPKKQRKKYETPKFAWQVDVLEAETKLLGEYGLRNKKELWRHKTELSRLRGTARSLLGMAADERRRRERQTLNRLRRLGILPETSVLDDVLDLSIEDILGRRIQTLVFQKDLAKSIHQARQFVVHGHIAIGDKRVSSPSYLVLKDEEGEIAYAPKSPLSNPSHLAHEFRRSERETKTDVPEEGRQ